MAFPRLFRIFYSTFFIILNIALFALLLITPADAIHQALSNNQLYNVFVIAGCYFLTLILATLIYVSRLYTNRSVLAGIPKTWVPVEEDDVGKSVRKMVVESLSRSAVIAWDARPRVVNHTITAPPAADTQGADVRSSETKEEQSIRKNLLRKNRAASEKDEGHISKPPHPPVWGEIAHVGWSSPTSPDLPNLHFVTVILELPHLIEAKAVSLAPPDPASTASPPMPDLHAVELLRRPAAMGLREYISHLTSLSVLSGTVPIISFLTAYETARFSPQPLTEPKFRELMRLFAEVLRGMTPLNPAVIDTLNEEKSDLDGDASSSSTTQEMPRSRSLASSRSATSRSSSEGTIRTAPSRRRATSRSTGTTPGPELSTAAGTPRGKKRQRERERERFIERTPSLQSLSLSLSFAQSKMPYAVSQASSNNSLRSGSGSGSGGSVIKLSRSSDPEDLPYTLQLDT